MNKIVTGGKKLKQAGSAMGKDILGDSMENLQKAMEMDS